MYGFVGIRYRSDIIYIVFVDGASLNTGDADTSKYLKVRYFDTFVDSQNFMTF